VGEVGNVFGLVRGRDFRADDRALEAVFDSLGQACVQSLVSVPHPFGLRPQDRAVARRWLSRRARQWQRDLVIVLAVIGFGLAIALLVLSFPSGAGSGSDAVQRSVPSARA
jgi:hypothetical protein